MEHKEFIDFNDIKQYAHIENDELFLLYLKEVYKDLADRNESNKKKGIVKMIFLDYLKLPIFISEKVFTVFDTDKDGYLNLKEFILGMNTLYNGTFEDSVKLIFDLLDFNRDGLIEKDDVVLMLSLLPLKTDRHKIEYKYQMETLEEIHEIINSTFGNKKVLKLEEFQENVEKRKSDVFLQILCYLYQKKPFSDSNIDALKTSKKTLPTDFNILTPSRKKMTCDNVLLPSPQINTALSPAFKLLSSNKGLSPLNLGKRDDKSSDTNPLLSGMQGMVRYKNRIIPKNEATKNNEELNEGEVNNLLKESESIYNSPSAYLKKAKKGPKPFSLELNPISEEATDINGEEKKENDEEEKDNNCSYENFIYKLGDNNKMKKYYLVLINKDIYYYKNDAKKEVLGMHNLSGCFYKEYPHEKINDKNFYVFSIVFPKKERKYYCSSQEIRDNFVNALKNSFHYLNFFDYYQMIEDLGEGIFGSVKLGVEKKTGERVAIKCIKKNKAKESDVELVRTEIDIMKLCHHPNVVRLLDHFENAEYIFIVMEYIRGGSLADYMKDNDYNFSEKRAAELIYQIADGLKYLHKYGIIHRDLKPDNIMMTESSEKGQIKIMDFGLSKILGKKEKSVDGFGTLTFVSPEVLIRKPYNKEVDIWSVGVILYMMLSGDLPFDDEEDDEQKIAKMIVFEEVKFPNEKFGKKSKEVIDLIKGCLTKDPKNRIKIDEILNSPWVKKQSGCN